MPAHFNWLFSQRNFQKMVMALAIVSTGVLLSGCPRTWTLSVTSLDDPAFPEFCISKHSDCSGPGISLAMADFVEVDDKGKPVETVWVLEATEGFEINRFRYGEVPIGYKEEFSAMPIEMNRFYSVAGMVYFRIVQSGDKYNAEIYSLDQFNKLFKWNPEEKKQ